MKYQTKSNTKAGYLLLVEMKTCRNSHFSCSYVCYSTFRGHSEPTNEAIDMHFKVASIALLSSHQILIVTAISAYSPLPSLDDCPNVFICKCSSQSDEANEK